MSNRLRTIRLVEPASPGHHVYSRIKLPRLGLPTIGAILKQSGYDVRIYCEDIGGIDRADLMSSDLVGISITTSTAPAGYRLADELTLAGIPAVIGGPHATFLPDEALEHAPYCVRGEGEETIVELVDRISAGDEVAGVAGLSYIDGDEVKHNSSRPLVADLDSLPYPDLGLIQGSEQIRITPLLTSRGCPFDCTFCSVTEMFGRRCRFRSVESVLDELALIRPKQIFFYDDNFTANRNRAAEICEGMIRQGQTAGWTAQARVDVARDEELLKLMQKSRCFMLYIGLESINPATLEALHKGQRVEEIEECIRKLHKCNIMVHGMFITGADQDESRTIRDTVDFSLRNGIDTIQFSTLTPLPGTRLYRQLEEENRLLTRDWSLYDGHHVVHRPKSMTPYVLQRETIKGMKRFYTLRQCVRLLVRFKFLSAFFRYYGHQQLKQWEAANREFMKWVKRLGKHGLDTTASEKHAA